MKLPIFVAFMLVLYAAPQIYGASLFPGAFGPHAILGNALLMLVGPLGVAAIEAAVLSALRGADRHRTRGTAPGMSTGGDQPGPR